MNKIGFLLAIGAMAATASAEQISESQAMAVATKYMQLGQPNRQLVPAPRTATASSAAPYYVFNSSDGKGFIIVSGDDELTEIVGYSTDGFFDTANIPANAQAWLDKYADYVARVQSGDAVARKVQVSTLAETIVEPLVTTRWNQDAPYNNMCPIDKNYNRRSVTGCGATAMAQVMKYWEWPVQGQGEHQNANDPSLEVDFSESVYDWDNMLDTYNSLSSQTAQDAVAKLMYDCGVSIDMSYSYVASGAYDSDIAIALGTYFGYKAQTYLRDAYTVNAFRELIKSELDNARPVLFGGQGTVGGHEYVVDGYDSNDFLHINWGWGGTSDGFYDMELMNPPSLGIGGGAGGFTEDQSIVTVQKDETMRGSTGQKSFNIYTMGEYGVNPQVDAAKKGDRIRIDVNNLWNITAHDFIGSVSVAVYDADFNRVAIAEGYSNLPLQGWNIIPELSFYLQDELEALADREYTVWAVTKEDVGDGYDYDWIRVAMPEFTIMTISGDDIIFGATADVVDVALTDAVFVEEGIKEPGDRVSFYVPLRNNATTPVSGVLECELQNATTGNALKRQSVAVSLSENGERVFEVPVTLSSSAFKEGMTYRFVAISFTVDETICNFDSDLASVDFFVGDPAGVGSMETSEITAYPNPTSGIVHIGGAAMADVEVYSADGRLIGDYKQVDSVDLTNNPRGIYVLKVTTGDASTMLRVVKK